MIDIGLTAFFSALPSNFFVTVLAFFLSFSILCAITESIEI